MNSATNSLIEESRLDLLMTDLCEARAEDNAAIAHAHALREETPGHLNTQGMDAFCKAGDRMMVAHQRKVDALEALSDEQQAHGTRIS